jgi:hypothetical protein
VDEPATVRGEEVGSSWRPATAAVDAPRFRPSAALAWLVVALLLASIGLTAFLAWRYGGESSAPLSLARPGALDELSEAVWLGLGRLALWVITAAAWFMWFDLVLRNVPAVGGGWPASSRLGAVGWWFVPIAWWWKPFRPVADVYARLAVPGGPGPWLPIAWWIAWLVMGWLPTLVGFAIGVSVGFGQRRIDEANAASATTDLIGSGLEVLAGILAIAVVVTIQRSQDARATVLRRLRASEAPAISGYGHGSVGYVPPSDEGWIPPRSPAPTPRPGYPPPAPHGLLSPSSGSPAQPPGYPTPRPGHPTPRPGYPTPRPGYPTPPPGQLPPAPHGDPRPSPGYPQARPLPPGAEHDGPSSPG